jgi:zinc protease
MLSPRPALLAAALALALAAAAAAPAPAWAADAFPFPVVTKTLPNGLRAVAIRFDSPGLLAYYTVVRTGSGHEVERGKSGFAHFFEHMMFRGTKRFSADAYNDVLKRMGADSNAWTWHDQTTYHILAGADALAEIVDLEADRFRHLEYDEAGFQKEARAVLGEYNKSASDPRLTLDEALHDAAFDAHPYEHTTLGFLKDIEAMPKLYKYSRAFFKRYYQPDNMVVLAVGDVDPDAFFALVDKHYGTWQHSRMKRPQVPAEPAQKAGKRVALTWPRPTLPRLVMAFKAPAFDADATEPAALAVLAQVVFAERGALYRQLVIDGQKVERLAAETEQKVAPYLFRIDAHVKDAADLGAVEAAITAALAKVAADGVDPKTLAEVKSNMRYSFAARLATAEDVASTAGWYLTFSDDVGAINRYYAKLAAVTSDDVKRVAAQVFTEARRTIVTLVQAPQEAGK